MAGAGEVDAGAVVTGAVAAGAVVAGVVVTGAVVVVVVVGAGVLSAGAAVVVGSEKADAGALVVVAGPVKIDGPVKVGALSDGPVSDTLVEVAVLGGALVCATDSVVGGGALATVVDPVLVFAFGRTMVCNPALPVSPPLGSLLCGVVGVGVVCAGACCCGCCAGGGVGLVSVTMIVAVPVLAPAIMVVPSSATCTVMVSLPKPPAVYFKVPRAVFIAVLVPWKVIVLLSLAPESAVTPSTWINPAGLLDDS